MTRAHIISVARDTFPSLLPVAVTSPLGRGEIELALASPFACSFGYPLAVFSIGFTEVRYRAFDHVFAANLREARGDVPDQSLLSPSLISR
jgi:hypothetical protein